MESMPPSSRVALRYEIARSSPDWTLSEENVPESPLHREAVSLIEQLLRAWIAKTGLRASVECNVAIRWDQARPRIGVDPDVCLFAPPPPAEIRFDSVRTWVAGHSAPRLAVEVVSANHPYKDYVTAPAKYAALGVFELWVFDPLLAGPKHLDGPHRLQIFRQAQDAFVRVYAGDGPARSEVLSAWLFVVREGERLRVADDREGTRWWETAEERERAEKERERAEKERAQAELAKLREEIAQLRAK